MTEAARKAKKKKKHTFVSLLTPEPIEEEVEKKKKNNSIGNRSSLQDSRSNFGADFTNITQEERNYRSKNRNIRPTLSYHCQTWTLTTNEKGIGSTGEKCLQRIINATRRAQLALTHESMHARMYVRL